MTCFDAALAWVEAHRDIIRKRGPWRIVEQPHGGAIRCSLGTWEADACPMSAALTHPIPVASTEELAGRHGIRETTARTLADAADGYSCSSLEPVRAALLDACEVDAR